VVRELRMGNTISCADVDVRDGRNRNHLEYAAGAGPVVSDDGQPKATDIPSGLLHDL
jgi:hypothetical protein